jgi:anti-sigma factor RsiW
MRKEPETHRTCHKPALLERIIFYITGAVSERERKAIEEHLPQCSSCQSELRFLLMAREIENKRIEDLRRGEAK